MLRGYKSVPDPSSLSLAQKLYRARPDAFHPKQGNFSVFLLLEGLQAATIPPNSPQSALQGLSTTELKVHPGLKTLTLYILRLSARQASRTRVPRLWWYSRSEMTGRLEDRKNDNYTPNTLACSLAKCRSARSSCGCGMQGWLQGFRVQG